MVEVGKVEEVPDGFPQGGGTDAGCSGLVAKALHPVRGVGGQGLGPGRILQPHAGLSPEPVGVETGKAPREFPDEGVGRSEEALGAEFEVDIVFGCEAVLPGIRLLKEHAKRDPVEEAFVGHAPVARRTLLLETFEGAVEVAGVVQGAVPVSRPF